MASAKRVDLSLADKEQIIKALHEPGAKQCNVAQLFGVSKSVVSRINKNSKMILHEYATCSDRSRKRQRSGKEADIDEALLLWFKQKLAQGVRLSGVVLKQNASQLATAQGKESNPSDGWLSRWKARNKSMESMESMEKSRMPISPLLLSGKQAFYLEFSKRLSPLAYSMRMKQLSILEATQGSFHSELYHPKYLTSPY